MSARIFLQNMVMLTGSTAILIFGAATPEWATTQELLGVRYTWGLFQWCLRSDSSSSCDNFAAAWDSDSDGWTYLQTSQALVIMGFLLIALAVVVAILKVGIKCLSLAPVLGLAVVCNTAALVLFGIERGNIEIGGVVFVNHPPLSYSFFVFMFGTVLLLATASVTSKQRPGIHQRPLLG